MPCTHLRELYELCEKHELRISSHDAIRIVCRQCQEQEVCPSSLTDGETVLRMPTQRASEDPEALGDGGANQKEDGGSRTSAERSPENRPR